MKHISNRVVSWASVLSVLVAMVVMRGFTPPLTAANVNGVGAINSIVARMLMK